MPTIHRELDGAPLTHAQVVALSLCKIELQARGLFLDDLAAEIERTCWRYIPEAHLLIEELRGRGIVLRGEDSNGNDQ
jgi:hypothetical protein